MTETEPNGSVKLLQKIESVVWWNTWCLKKKSSRLWTERGYEADTFKTISSTEGKQRNVKRNYLVLLRVLERENNSECRGPIMFTT